MPFFTAYRYGRLLAVLLLLYSISSASFGQTIANWAFGATLTAPNVVDPNATAPIATITTPTPATSIVSSRFRGQGWNVTSIDLARYFEVSITPNAPYDLTIQQFIINLDKSASGPTNYEARISVDNFSTSVAIGSGPVTITTTNVSMVVSSVVRVTTTAKIRVYFWGSSTSTDFISIGSATIIGKVVQPTLTTIPVTLSGFTTSLGAPSTTKTYSISGANLLENLVITAPAGYEISTSSGSGFSSTLTLTQSGGTITSTTIYVRLTGASVGAPSGNITNVSSGVTSTVALTGTVQQPVITLSTGSLSGFSTNYNSPSATQTYTLGGTALIGNITVMAPAGYEVGIGANPGSFAASQSVPPTNGSVNQIMAVRLTGKVATPTTIAVNGLLTHTSTSATQQDLSLQGQQPVQLVSFKGQAAGNSVILNWSTASEQESAQFVVQRSSDASEFISVGTRQSAGTTNQQQYYSLTDESPQNGVNYYRLRQVDRDGSSVYSKAIAVRVDASQPYASLRENPTDGQAIALKLYHMEAPQVRLSSLTGQIIAGQLARSGPTEAIYTPASALAPGLYIITVQEGTVRQAMKVVVK